MVEQARRGARGWAVDTVLFAFAVFAWLYLVGERIRIGMPSPSWLFEVDQVAGLIGLGLLWLRRRRPAQAALVAAVLSGVSETIAFPLIVLLFAVTVRCSLRVAALVYAVSLSATFVYWALRPEEGFSLLGNIVFSVVLSGAVAGWGLFVRYRRQLRARAAEQERAERERARQKAREELAREVHDLLGHRLSLLSLHAGAIEYRPDAPPEELAGAAGVIREQSHLAMRDLREVIAVLRAPIGELPQPTMADLRDLVEEARPGMRIELSVDAEGEVPDRSGRTAYRIVQESLTNARRHAEGAAVAVTVAGGPEEGLRVAVRSGPGEDAGAGSGHGLIGLEERTALAGGRLAYGPTAEGGWLVEAWLPWTA